MTIEQMIVYLEQNGYEVKKKGAKISDYPSWNVACRLSREGIKYEKWTWSGGRWNPTKNIWARIQSCYRKAALERFGYVRLADIPLELCSEVEDFMVKSAKEYIDRNSYKWAD